MLKCLKEMKKIFHRSTENSIFKKVSYEIYTSYIENLNDNANFMLILPHKDKFEVQA